MEDEEKMEMALGFLVTAIIYGWIAAFIARWIL